MYVQSADVVATFAAVAAVAVVAALVVVDVVAGVILGAFATLVPFFGLRSTSKPSNLFGAWRFARAGRIDMVFYL